MTLFFILICNELLIPSKKQYISQVLLQKYHITDNLRFSAAHTNKHVFTPHRFGIDWRYKQKWNKNKTKLVFRAKVDDTKEEIQTHINKSDKIRSDQDHLVCHPSYVDLSGVALLMLLKNCFLHPLVCQILGLKPGAKITSKLKLNIFTIVFLFYTSVSTKSVVPLNLVSTFTSQPNFRMIFTSFMFFLFL